MIELIHSEFSHVIPLLHQNNVHCTFAYAVVEGIQPGRIYTDHRENPGSCLIRCSSGKYLVAGAADNKAFNSFLSDFLLNKENHSSYFDLYSSSQDWIVIVYEILGDRAAKLTRKLYHWNHEKTVSPSDWKAALPEGYQLKKMDEALFEKYAKEMDPSYLDLWGSGENFMAKGFGFCILRDQELASVCNTYYVSEGYAEIDIVTKDEHRRKGLAQIACAAFIHHCLNLGIEPVWDCDNGNRNSKVLAEKLGFKPIETYDMHWWHENQKFVESYLKKFSYSNE